MMWSTFLVVQYDLNNRNIFFNGKGPAQNAYMLGLPYKVSPGDRSFPKWGN